MDFSGRAQDICCLLKRCLSATGHEAGPRQRRASAVAASRKMSGFIEEEARSMQVWQRSCLANASSNLQPKCCDLQIAHDCTCVHTHVMVATALTGWCCLARTWRQTWIQNVRA